MGSDHSGSQRLPLSALCHPACIVCRPQAAGGLGLAFEATQDGAVEADFLGSDPYQGYTGILHGGVIAMLLDAAMTNCLFAQGQRGVTAELTVRFRHPVSSNQPSRLRAWVQRSSQPLFVLHAELRQSGQCRATAIGKFMRAGGKFTASEQVGRFGEQGPSTESDYPVQGQSHGK
jgi:uncharacterized protein (TIGR00369 family)